MTGIISRLEQGIWRLRRKAAFKRNHGHVPNLDHPRTFSEKLFKRIMDGEDPMYLQYGMKHKAPNFVRNRGVHGLKLARQLKVVDRLQPSDFEGLPVSFVIKSSFGSGLNEVVYDRSTLDVEATCRRFNGRLRTLRNAQNRRCLDNVAIFEEFIGDPQAGSPPDDYKFHCFNRLDGTFHCFIQVDSARFGVHRQTILDCDFKPVGFDFAGQIRHETMPERPQRLDDLLRIAKAVSAGFDYVRVDLFDTPDGIYFGEITPFHRGGTARILQPEWEQSLGDLWDQRFPDYQSAEAVAAR